MTKDVKKASKKGFIKQIRLWLDRSRIGDLLVDRGTITREQLREALLLQRQTNQPLGQVFIQQRIITRRELAYMLGRQHMLRSVAAGVLLCASIGISKKARADLIKDIPASISISAPAMGTHFSQVAAYPALFGSAEKASGNLKPFTKWTSMFDRFEREMQSSQNARVIENWQANLYGLQGLPLKTMADKVNRLVNGVRYINDSKNWGQTDYWATPVEFLNRGGDCEDFAIAKYTALRTLGVPEERLRIAIVHDKAKNIPHAVLIVYTDQGSYVLDNQNTNMLDAERDTRYRPIFSINRTAWWLHTAPGTTVLASAQ